ncbi:hypothetical protein Afe04nite_20970 [Asanoa ferruginea]|nr:hypothetical protein Afe04nite_20970 [Asanoa ferruginea]
MVLNTAQAAKASSIYCGDAPADSTSLGRPSFVSPVFGSNGTVAWEPVPGLVAYVGYSGAELNDAAVTALQRLAVRARLLNGSQWQSTGPFTANQSNEPS